MKMKILAIAAGLMLLTGCTTTTVDDREERAAEAMYSIQALDSQTIADGMDKTGWYDSVAEDLVRICDEHEETYLAYRAPLEEQQGLGHLLDAGWAVACPD